MIGLTTMHFQMILYDKIWRVTRVVAKTKGVRTLNSSTLKALCHSLDTVSYFVSVLHCVWSIPLKVRMWQQTAAVTCLRVCVVVLKTIRLSLWLLYCLFCFVEIFSGACMMHDWKSVLFLTLPKVMPTFLFIFARFVAHLVLNVVTNLVIFVCP